MAQNLRDLMTENPKTVKPGDSITEAAKQMRDADVGAIPVVDGDELKGILTDRDTVLRVVAEGKDPDKVKVEEVCTTDVATVEPDSSLEDAVKLMREKDIRRVVVTEGAKPVGIVSLGDLAVKQDDDSVLADISAAEPNN